MSVMQAIAVINEASRRGVSVPRDLSVVGYNDIPDAERSDPNASPVAGEPDFQLRASDCPSNYLHWSCSHDSPKSQ
jgi:hypothetical protein